MLLICEVTGQELATKLLDLQEAYPYEAPELICERLLSWLIVPPLIPGADRLCSTPDDKDS